MHFREVEESEETVNREDWKGGWEMEECDGREAHEAVVDGIFLCLAGKRL